MTARPIHPADLAFIRGEYRIQPRLPQVAGLEGAGIIIRAGEVSRFPPEPASPFAGLVTWAELVAQRHRVVVRYRHLLTQTNVCEQLAREDDLEVDTAAFASLTPHQREIVAAFERLARPIHQTPHGPRAPA